MMKGFALVVIGVAIFLIVFLPGMAVDFAQENKCQDSGYDFLKSIDGREWCIKISGRELHGVLASEVGQ